MKQFFTLFLVSFSVYYGLGQSSDTKDQYAEAVKLIGKAKDKDARLPSSLDDQLPVLHRFLEDMPQDTTTAKKTLKQTCLTIAEIEVITQKTKAARAMLGDLKAAFNDLSNNRQNTIIFKEQYAAFKIKNKKFEAAFDEVMTLEKKSLRNFGRYLKKNLGAKDTSITTMIFRYFKKIIEEKEASIAEVTKKIEELSLQKGSIEQALNDKKNELRALNDSLHSSQREKNSKIDTLQQDIKQKEARLDSIQNSLKKLRSAKTEIEKDNQDMNIEKGKLEVLIKEMKEKQQGMKTTAQGLSNEINQLTRERDSVKTVNQNLAVEKTQREKDIQEEEATTIKLNKLFLIFAILAALAAAFFYARKHQNTRIGKDKVEKLNVELSRANEILYNLIRESHHRIKNNLIDVSEVIDLQLSMAQDSRVKSALEDAKERVEVMALIHQKLYKAEHGQLMKVRIGDYIEELLNLLISINKFSPNTLQLHLNIEPIAVDMDFTAYIGLIINELVQNALKHAYAGVAAPSLALVLRRNEDGMVEIKIKDNGPGIYSGTLASVTQNSFGLTLVKTLSEGRNGSVEYHFDHGSEFTVTMMPNDEEIEVIV